MVHEAVFLDTNGWIALLNASDQLHQIADREWRKLIDAGSGIVLTDWIVAETGNGLARTTAREGFSLAVRTLLSSLRVEFIEVRGDLFQQSLNLYAARSDKTWGLVDCASFEAMRMRNVAAAFTNDRHFEQAGFEALLSTK